ncbi:hypothetical protein N658DRAFT_518600 [Parathielavia hyrcaniae]|uniref:ER transporter 6TM N-terminal domain-containing protein n=1 Tax=Parathielavia hyrcaniae TaxID=113614 RepID=A0AAN6PY31_9PEZI|nr:hypothetical protein N658DRAFT_518600 [Parathielavia hyrcaniae]
MSPQGHEAEPSEATDPTTARDNRRRMSTNGDPDVPREEKKPSRLSALVSKLGLDAGTLKTMFKGSLPPTIAVAMLQAPPVAAQFATVGYLVPIISVLAMAVMPRGKFMMNLLLNALAVCVGSAVSMLALWSAIQARNSTSASGYSSSQSAVCAVWLFANIWFGNVVRAKLPAFNLPVITYSILVNISATFGPLMATTAAAHIFVQQLLTAMLTALALALAVNLLVFPVSSRLVVFKELARAIGLLRKLVSLQKAYLASLEPDAAFAAAMDPELFPAKAEGATHPDDNDPRPAKEAEAAKPLEETAAKMRELSGKLHADLPFAKRDLAWGKLDAKDLSEMYKLFRNVYIPVLGMNTIIDIFQRFSESPDWDRTDDTPNTKDAEKHVWNEVMRQLQEPFEILSLAVDQGLEHAAMCLELVPRHKKASGKAGKPGLSTSDIDLEAHQEPKPGDPGFARVLGNKIQAFYSKKGELLKMWVQERGISLDKDTSDRPYFRSERDQVQLYIILYMESLMHASGGAVQDLVDFADEKVDDGTMSKKRLIIPTIHRLRKWFLAVLSDEDASAEQTPDAMEAGANMVSFGGNYNRKKDPEHLPPETAWQRFGNGLRKISNFFGSEESLFGLRVACATMTIGIVAFLENTQQFFVEQRLVWALIIITIGWASSTLSRQFPSGQSFFGFLCRVGGTIVAMCLSLIIWYIVGGRIPGVIVFLWLSIFISYYFFVKFPRFLPAVLIAIITQVLIIGYGLQVLAIGKAAAERTGQPFYPSNVHGTAGDVNVPGTPAHHLFKAGRKIFGKVMMLIPSMSQHSEWQKWEPTVGGKFPRDAYKDIIKRSTRIMAYLTLASYTMMHPTHVRLSHHDEDDDERRVRRSHLRGASQSLHSRSRAPSLSSANREWMSALAAFIDVLKPTHHTILSTLTLLSNSLLSGQSLPPFLPLPRPYEMTRQLMRLRRSALPVTDMKEGDHNDEEEDDDDVSDGAPIRMVDTRTGLDDYTAAATTKRRGHARRNAAVANILDPRNIEQPGYAEFAVLQICTVLVCGDLEALLTAVSGLVGVVDFCFSFDDSDSSLDLGRKEGKRKRH